MKLASSREAPLFFRFFRRRKGKIYFVFHRTDYVAQVRLDLILDEYGRKFGRRFRSANENFRSVVEKPVSLFRRKKGVGTRRKTREGLIIVEEVGERRPLWAPSCGGRSRDRKRISKDETTFAFSKPSLRPYPGLGRGNKAFK